MKIISVVQDFDMYSNFVKNNPFNQGANFFPFDNTKENKFISVRYNEFLNTYDYDAPDWFVFCHEDFELKEDLREKLETLNKDYLYGPIGTQTKVFSGMKNKTVFGKIICSEKDGSNKIDVGIYTRELQTVDTFDCQCLIVHSDLIKKYNLRFDENLSWDLYVEDFCINAQENHNIPSKVLQLNCQHYSFGTVQQRFFKQMKYLQKKYKKAKNSYSTTATEKTIGKKAFITLMNRTANGFSCPFFTNKTTRSGKRLIKICKIPVYAKRVKPLKPILVHVHIYYTEMWEELKRCLKNINQKYELHISMVEEHDALKKDILKFKPDAKIELVENRGFNVAPFINVINQVNLDDYDHVIKDKRIIKAPKKKAKLPAFPESKIIHQYLDGLNGIEIGASAHNSFGLERTGGYANVDFSANQEGYWSSEFEAPPAKVNLVCLGDNLPFKENTFDYVINSHVLEHFFDPIKAVEEWFRVIKPNGYIAMIIPHKERTFDNDREITTTEELIKRYTGQLTIKDYGLDEDDHHRHWSVWDTQSFLDLCINRNWNVVESLDVDDKVGNGFCIILQKISKKTVDILDEITFSEKYCGNQEDNCLYGQVYKQQTKFISHKWEHYLPIYNKLLSGVLQKNDPITLLEIGVQNGGSLETWKDFLPKDSKILGVDIDEKCLKIPFSENIEFFLGSASDKTFIEKNFKDTHFDVILDDGSHISDDVINSFELLWDKLNKGGIYIVEDCHTSYWPAFNGGFKKENAYIEYFKKLIDAINYRYILTTPYEENTKEMQLLKKLNQEISAIYFYDSVIVIEKYLTKRTIPFRDYITQGEALVSSFSDVKRTILCNESTKLEKIYRD